LNLSEHFTVAEFTASQEAVRRGIDNDLPVHLIVNARKTAELLERIRAHLSQLAGREIRMPLSSGYRCLALNRAIGSSDTSDHVNADAADWSAPDFGSPKVICEVLAPLVGQLGIGQLINEYPDRRGWVHTSTRLPAKMINRIITITGRGTFPGVVG
jgi:zinc D-Ala-D-Ala carboxypeptidase